HVAQADQFEDAATGRTLFSAVVRPSLDWETVRAIVFAEENGAPAWTRAMARPNILSQLPILDWPERAAERNPQLFASALKGLLSRLRDQPDRVWSPETKNISRHLRWMSKHGPATRRAVAAFVRELRSLRAELTDIVVHAPGDTVVQRIYNIGRIMAERGLGGDEPYRVAERVLNACPASETMRELSQALA
ncbi:MAG: hypothetical protein NZ898_17450, partial [Myxococcota bacterium]|nr:hypothetical protein [Myxococcota bacterium]